MTDEQPAKAGKDSPHLDAHQKRQAARMTPAAARVIHEVLREEGQNELKRSTGALLWSGLAAGLSMGFSFLTLAMLQVTLAGTAAVEAVAPIGYSVGFLIAVLGKQQLFTETTLTATLPIMLHPSWISLARLARMWAAVLFSNIVGTFIFAALLSIPGVMKPEIAESLAKVAHHAFSETFGVGLLRAMFAGWLIALMVWLLQASARRRPSSSWRSPMSSR